MQNMISIFLLLWPVQGRLKMLEIKSIVDNLTFRGIPKAEFVQIVSLHVNLFNDELERCREIIDLFDLNLHFEALDYILKYSVFI